MGRKKNLSQERLDKTISKLDKLMEKYRKLKHSQKEELILEIFKKVFENRITSERLSYGEERIKYLFTPIGVRIDSQLNVLLAAFEKEAEYLLKNKTRIPDWFLSLISMSLIDELFKLALKIPKSEKIVEITKALHELSAIGPDDYEDNLITKNIPLDIIEHILKRNEYDAGLRALIFKSERSRLKNTFRTYQIHANNEYPYYYYNRLYDAETIFQYLYLMLYFKLEKEITKKSPYPPKRIEALQCIQARRINTADSTGKIYTQIQAILDPDHSSNYSISTKKT